MRKLFLTWLQSNPKPFLASLIFNEDDKASARLIRVFTTATLCATGWWDSKARYWLVSEQSLHALCILYVSGFSEKPRSVFRKYSIRTVFRTSSTLRRELSRIKDPALKPLGVVYDIPCGCGLKYIGETKRALETHLNGEPGSQEERQRNQQSQSTP